MAKKLVIFMPQYGYDEDVFHQLRKSTAAKLILTFMAAREKTGTRGNKGELLLPNMNVKEIHAQEFDGIIFINGQDISYADDIKIQGLLKDFFEANRIIGGIDNGTEIIKNICAIEDIDNGEPVIVHKNLIITQSKENYKEFCEKVSEIVANMEEKSKPISCWSGKWTGADGGL